MFTLKELEAISTGEVIGEACLFLLVGFFLYMNYIVGKAASNSNKIDGFLHVIRIVLFSFISAVVVPFSVLRINDFEKFIPGLSVAGFIVALSSAFFTRKVKG